MEFIQEPEFERFQILDENGEITNEEEMPDLSNEELLEMYRYMVLAKEADDKSLTLQRQGRMGTYASLRGQEAAQVGSAYALQEGDWMFPSFRETAVWPVRDLPLKDLMVYWMGDERGMEIPEENNDFTVSVPVGSQVLHATGSAWASKKLGEDSASLVYFGDGATSEGDFHEGLNFAGTFDLPVVYLCQNNQYAISMRREEQTAASSLAQKATAYGFEGIQVDGNDVLAMYKATEKALEKARDNEPVLVEAYTYRLENHTTADDASRYRDEEEVEEWKKKDPIDRFQKFLKEEGVLDNEKIEEIQEEMEERVEKAVEEAEAIEDPELEDMFDYMYEEKTPRLHAQLERLKEFEGGDEQ
ncbi:MAG: pyruvate dehydrogenase (acetyl-transferring) E1 component subunit alpha [Candidatus Nanohaloarchaeota archaeon QJJ-7]|nr:pyruvate dehydrogenase (acetyl-transferring) E1 component subunit alpha [Candidatus Nanohaloarchaeota archaeon QJJ-7]